MADKEMLLVQSKVRDIIRENGLRTTDEFLAALNEHLHATVTAAMRRCRLNERQTLRDQDI
jgi:hypothetical protein